MRNPRSENFLMWVDAVGGFLVCRGESVVLGQAVPGNSVEVPLQADISRRHASIRRDGENYLIVPAARVKVDGELLTGPARLVDGNEIDLGGMVRLEFHKPHPLSATARLQVVSHHRTQPPVDAVILMADTCVLGPQESSHVVARDFQAEKMLFEQKDRLLFRCLGNFVIDGKNHENQGPITRDSTVSGDDFTLSLESL